MSTPAVENYMIDPDVVVIRVKRDSYNYRKFELTVRAEDLPADVRACLVKWLAAGSEPTKSESALPVRGRGFV